MTNTAATEYNSVRCASEQSPKLTKMYQHLQKCAQNVPKNTKMYQKIKPKYFILHNSIFFYADISVTSVTNSKSVSLAVSVNYIITAAREVLQQPPILQ